MLSLAELPTLRQAMRQRRAALDTGSLQRRALSAASYFSSGFSEALPHDNALRIALYSACAGELDPAPLRRLAELATARFYLPIVSGQTLRFGETTGVPMRKNRFGIAEPEVTGESQLTADELDIIIVPLLAFDNCGNRLGMGGGFYDRALQSTAVKPETDQPLRIGYAHDFQRVEALPSQTWDVPLHGIVTERLARRF